MTRLAVSGMQGFSVSRMEIDREGVTYTVDTLTRVQLQMPGAELYFLIGEDTLFDLPNWRRPDKVFTLCRFLVCSRETGELAQDPQVRELEERGARAGVIWQDGAAFAWPDSIRMNLALPHSRLVEAMERRRVPAFS